MKRRMKALASAGAILAAMTATAAADEEDYQAYLNKYVSEYVKAALQAPEVIAAIQAQNVAHANLTEADIAALDRQWRAERKTYGGALVDSTMSSPASAFLRGFKAASGGVISEIFIMDNKGLNAGQTDPTGDYMQGDEDKWLKTFALGPWMGFTDAPEEEDGVKTVQVSMSVVDNDKAIGALTVGINIAKLPKD